MNTKYTDIQISKTTMTLLLVITFIFAFAIWLINHSTLFQSTWNPFPVNHDLENLFCEKGNANNIIRQPVNTFSNIIYLLVPIIIFINAKQNADTIAGRINKFYESFLGLLLIFIFSSSVLFHATLSDLPLKLDYTAVCAFVAFPSIYLLGGMLFNKQIHSGKGLKGLFLMLYFILFISLFLLTHNAEHNLEMLVLIIIFFVIAFIASNKNKANREYLFFSIGSITVAIGWYELDRYKLFCKPDSFFQPHSLWHVFVGVSAFYFYQYMLGQREKIYS